MISIVWTWPFHQDSAVFAKLHAAYFTWSLGAQELIWKTNSVFPNHRVSSITPPFPKKDWGYNSWNICMSRVWGFPHCPRYYLQGQTYPASDSYIVLWCQPPVQQSMLRGLQCWKLVVCLCCVRALYSFVCCVSPCLVPLEWVWKSYYLQSCIDCIGPMLWGVMIILLRICQNVDVYTVFDLLLLLYQLVSVFIVNC